MSKVKYGGKGSLEDMTVWFSFWFEEFFRRGEWKNSFWRTLGLPVC